jgi:DNA-binding CsgD family transcriptional regulator
MSKFFSAEKIIDIIKNTYSVYFGEQEKEDILINNDNFINEFSRNENSIKLVFDLVNTKFLSVSDNFESMTGYKVEDVLKLNIGFILNVLTLDHFLFPYVWVTWISGIYKKTGNLDNLKITFCGMKAKHKNGQVRRILIRYSPIEVLNNTKDGVSKTATMTIDDVTHLYKADFYWARAEFGLHEKQHHHLLSTNKKDIPHDIISEREKDVLHHIARGMESKEIAQTLLISHHTVDNHRRNMIARTGIKDTTGLAQICKMCGII